MWGGDFKTKLVSSLHFTVHDVGCFIIVATDLQRQVSFLEGAVLGADSPPLLCDGCGAASPTVWFGPGGV